MNVSDVTALVLDHGLFIPVAQRLARDFNKVYYWTHCEHGFTTVNDCVIGRGFDDIERVDDFWDVLDKVDVVVFPDVQMSGLQLHLEEMGIPVWGSRKGDSLELERVKFLNTLKEVGLPQPGFTTVMGLDKLKEFLKTHDDKYVKVSRYRGSLETFHHVTYDLSEPMLDLLAVRFGAVKNVVPFVICDPIDTEIEAGMDSYCIDGKFPSMVVQGYESKDKGYIATLQQYSSLPDEISVVNEKLAPLLGQYRYRNFFSTEIRVKDGDSYLIDPCCRAGKPSSESQLELYQNVGEIVWAGSQGELVDPIPAAKFSVEAVMCLKADKQVWGTIEVPKEIRQWVKLSNCCYINDTFAFPPEPDQEDDIGWIMGIGNTIQEAIDHLKENVELMGDCRVHVNVESLVDLLKEIEVAEENDIPFTNQEIPSPESVIKE